MVIIMSWIIHTNFSVLAYCRHISNMSYIHENCSTDAVNVYGTQIVRTVVLFPHLCIVFFPIYKTNISSWSQMSFHQWSHSLFISVWLLYIVEPNIHETYATGVLQQPLRTKNKHGYFAIRYFNLLYLITYLNFRN